MVLLCSFCRALFREPLLHWGREEKTPFLVYCVRSQLEGWSPIRRRVIPSEVIDINCQRAPIVPWSGTIEGNRFMIECSEFNCCYKRFYGSSAFGISVPRAPWFQDCFRTEETHFSNNAPTSTCPLWHSQSPEYIPDMFSATLHLEQSSLCSWNFPPATSHSMEKSGFPTGFDWKT